MVRRKKLVAFSLVAAAFFAAGSAWATKPRDDFFNPQTPGTRLKLFPFFGPAFRATLENRAQLETDISELQTQVIADANPGFAEGSLNFDLRLFLVSFGASVGVRRDWHLLRFQPDENGEDHGETELNRDSRWEKDFDTDWDQHTWPWYEGRLRFIMPMPPFLGVSTFSVRYQDRGFEGPAYDWAVSTVFDTGLFGMNESFLVLRGKRWGFAGPAVRVLYVPRNDQYDLDIHYGVLAGTQVGENNRDLVLLRLYTTLGIKDDLMGTHAFQAPIQIVFGYSAEFEL